MHVAIATVYIKIGEHIFYSTEAIHQRIKVCNIRSSYSQCITSYQVIALRNIKSV